MKSTFSRNIEISVELKNTHSWKAKPIDSTGCFSIYEAMETFETWVIQYQRDIGTLGWISLDYPDSLTFIAIRPSRFKRGRRLFLSSRPSNKSIVLPSPLNHPRISLLLLICFSFLPFSFFYCGISCSNSSTAEEQSLKITSRWWESLGMNLD